MTREVVADAPGDAFGWRISIATIDRDAPFSTFAGYDRTLVQLAGGALALTLPDDQITLHPGEHVAFAGEDVVAARVGETATVLNVMTDRTRFTHRIDRWAVCGDHRVTASGMTVVIALTSGLHADDIALEPLDAVRTAAVPIVVTGTGTALAITFTPND